MKIVKMLRRHAMRAPQLEIPEERLAMLSRGSRRRMSDMLLETLLRACSENDMRTATGLYVVLEDYYHRPNRSAWIERRTGDETLLKAREAMDRCRARTGAEEPAAS